ncbi:hypothetical protein pb186bvf_000405 [Paramecium bursaria]
MNKLLIATLALLAIAAVYTTTRVDRKSQFEAWKARHGFKYSATEDLYRFRIYAQAIEEIEAHNADTTQTYKQGENQFTAMTQEEFVSFLTYMPQQNRDQYEVYEAPEGFKPVGAVDWSSQVKVKDQGQCGSCWAFSAVAGVEAFLKITKGQTVDLAEQQLVDCDNKSSAGCDGGYQDLAVKWIAKNGIVNQSQYPYTAKTGSCKVATGTKYISGYKAATTTQAIQDALQKYPLTVAVDATNWSRYSSGVFSNCAKQLNHAVLLVGFNADNTWIVKNSWGTGWGLKGFITLASGNTCGVTAEAVHKININIKHILQSASFCIVDKQKSKKIKDNEKDIYE